VTPNTVKVDYYVEHINIGSAVKIESRKFWQQNPKVKHSIQNLPLHNIMS